jgi:hypothetical protein
MQPASVLEAARDAARRGIWTEAYASFRGVDPSVLGPEDLEAFADAAWWMSRLDESIGLRQKAFTGFVAAGANRRAEHAAWFLSFDYFFRNDTAIASGWLSRDRRLRERRRRDAVAGGVLRTRQCGADPARGAGRLARVGPAGGLLSADSSGVSIRYGCVTLFGRAIPLTVGRPSQGSGRRPWG